MNGLLHVAAQCWIVHKTLKRQHTAQNHSTTVSKIYSYLANYVKFLKQ